MMKTLKLFDEFNYELLTEESKFKDKLKFLFGNVGNKLKDLIHKDNVKLGKFADRAKSLNQSDFVEFIMRVAPEGKGIKNSKQISEFLKKVANYMQWPFIGISLFIIFYKKIPGVGEYMTELLSHDLTKSRVFAGYAAILYTYFGSSIIADILKWGGGSTDIEIQISKDNDSHSYNIDFRFFYSVNVKNKYRILYNAFVRKLQEYENEEGFEIKYGWVSKSRNMYSGNQHEIHINFYPLEFINILKDFSERKEYHHMEFNIDDQGNCRLYVQSLTNEDILYLADQIKNMVVRAHPIDTVL